MDKTIKQFISDALSQPVWNTHKRVGSEFVFEIGNETEVGRGEYHFVVSNCHWWLQRDGKNLVVDIVHSESDQKKIESEIKILNGHQLKNLQFKEDIKSFIFDFNNGLFLRLSPYGSGFKSEQWQIFTPKQFLSVMPDGTAKIGEI